MPDSLMEFQRIPAPDKGLWDGVDPRSPEFPDSASPDLENIRVGAATWKTRKGMALWKTIPGSGAVRWLFDFYTSTGARIRLAARGDGAAAQLYDYLEGTDTTFQTVSGGGSLGGTAEPYFTGVVLGDVVYFLDRAGPMRKYTASTRTVTTVAQPVKPTAAPTVKPRSYDVLEDWSGAAPFGWTVADSAKFDIVSGTATQTPPTGGNSALLDTKTNPKDSPISKNVANESVPSHTIAFWALSVNPYPRIAFQYGQVTATDFSEVLNLPAANNWYPIFVNIGNLGTINFKRFVVIQNANAPDHYVGQIVLPGRLQGAYRWVYTHYDPATGRESPASAISNGGAPIDLSVIGTTNQPGSASAFQKCAVLSFTSDSGTDATTTKIRIYRNGGVGSLTKNDAGQDVWLRVGEVFDQSTTVSGGPSAGAVTFSVASATNIAIGDWLVIAKGVSGTNAEEYVRVTNVVGTTITIAHGLSYAHTNGQTVQVAFLDNVGNESVDVTTPIELERDDPPTAAKWISRTGDGRLVLANYASHPTGVALSNRATPDRPRDYEIFPNNVDPLTRRSPNQGFRFDLRGDTTDEVITWMQVFEGTITILTRRHLYLINANSQLDWGPDAIQAFSKTGCIAGDTVAECNGVLYWLTDGPRIVRWNGRGSEVETISQWRANARLFAAPVAYWANWFGRYHSKRDGHYYCLYFTPSGQTTNTQRLDYAIHLDAFEPCTFLASGGAYLAWQAASVRNGGSDTDDLYQAASTGAVYQTETGTTDDGVAIAVRAASKKFALSGVALLHSAWVWADAVTDTLSITAQAEGSEYGTISHVYSHTLAATNGEIKQRLTRDLNGRWAQILLTGSLVNGPEIHEVSLWHSPVRVGRLTLG